MPSDLDSRPSDDPGHRRTDDGLSADLAARVTAWVSGDPDPRTAAEAAALLHAAQGSGPEAAAAAAHLADRFAAPLAFGTAGLRGRLGAGPNRMNRAVVIRAAAGLHAYLADVLAAASPRGPAPCVVIGYDARHGSATFARDTAAVVTAAGGQALLLPSALPTPVLAFAVRHLGADAGVMVTASHNPAPDNGYKVYLGGRVERGPGQGAQLAPPTDSLIAEQIAAVGPAAAVPRAPAGWEVLGPEVVDAYVARAAHPGAPASAGPQSLRIVLTPLHGVGGLVAARALREAGFDDVHLVAEQADPNPDFPTVAFPNPEEPGALDAALATARRVGADLVLALDPDADRCAVAVPDATEPGGWRALTGDDVGALLGEQAAREASAGAQGRTEPPAAAPALASSVVSSRLLAAIARAHGLGHVTTLTGFKWIARVPGLVYGYEEALGYCVDPNAVRDKDGIAAAVRVAQLAAARADRGSSLTEALEELWDQHGVHATAQVALRATDPSQISAIMARLRAQPPRTLADSSVTRVVDLSAGGDDLPPTDAVSLRTADSDRVVVRPSGTEPKLKCYLEVVAAAPEGDVALARATAAERLEALRAAVAALVGA